MRPTSQWIAAGLVCLWATALTGAEKLGLTQVLAQIERTHAKLSTFKAGITHERSIPLLDVTETMSGKLLFKKPRNLRIEFEKPERQINLIVGQQVSVYTPRKKLVELYRLNTDGAGQVRAIGIGFMDSVAEASKDFVIQLEAEEVLDGKKTAKLSLKPRPGKESGPYDMIHIWFDVARWVPVQLRLSESRDEVVTLLKLTHIEFPRSLPDSHFKLDLPRDVDVVPPPG